MSVAATSLRRFGSPVIARGAVMGASLVAATLLIRVRGLGLFGLLATLLLLARVGSALMLGESQLSLAQRAISARAALALRPLDVVRVALGAVIAAAGAIVAAERFGASSTEVAAVAVLSIVLAVVAALMRLEAIALAQSGRTSMSVVCDISVVAPPAALTFLIPDLHAAAALQIVALVALGAWITRLLLRAGGIGERSPVSPVEDLVAFAVYVLPMLQGSIGPVLGMFGLDSDSVGLLVYAQRLASAAPLILAGGGAAVLAVRPARALATTVQYARWGGAVFAVISAVMIAAWPLIRAVLGRDDIGVTVVALVFLANFINVASGPIGQYCAIAGRQRLDLISLVAALAALVPFLVLPQSATRAAVAAVVVATVRALTVWVLVLRVERSPWRAPVGQPTSVGGVGVD